MYVASRAHAIRARVCKGGGGGAGRGSQLKNPQNFFCEKSCRADAPTPYFKAGPMLRKPRDTYISRYTYLEIFRPKLRT
jgi:hypothetical protein